MYAQEEHNLPAEDRRRLRRKQRRYVELWKDTLLRTETSDLGERLALLRVEAVFGLLNAAPNVSSTFTDDELRSEIVRAAEVALLGRRGSPR